ncbi:MAG: hypothetical protein ACOX5R_09965 [bacterium]
MLLTSGGALVSRGSSEANIVRLPMRAGGYMVDMEIEDMGTGDPADDVLFAVKQCR